jgi:NADH-quinone oxidoreductase subunit L
MAYLNLFMFSMIVLVLGASLPVTFLGWEGVGLCSYLLIGFWHRDTPNNDAARKAFIVNRIGDLGFILGAFALYAVMSDTTAQLLASGKQELIAAGQGMSKHISLSYVDISSWFRMFSDERTKDALALALGGNMGMLTAACLLIFFGCTGKSAQIPLLTWLPDAMAGPTPVSALIHAATMVTAGVYLVARLCDVYVQVPQVMDIIAIVGCATAVYGAIAGLVQTDIKKVLAYSTISQLGFMFMAVGAGAFDVALFHVFTHAFFKATLFLGAGSVIHCLHHEQDLRRMGGLAKALPITYSCMFFGWYAIIGMPLGSGFMSKDMILERLFESNVSAIIGIVALATALLTAVYMSRLMYLAFWSPSRVDEKVRSHLHEAPFSMTLPVFILGIGSMVAGTVWVPFMSDNPVTKRIDFGSYLYPVLGQAQKVVLPHLYPEPGHPAEAHNPLLMPIVGIGLAVFGWLLARMFWKRGPLTGGEPSPELPGFSRMWTFLFDRIYVVLVLKPLQGIAWFLSSIVDRAILGGALSRLSTMAYFLSDGYVSCQRSRLRSSLAISMIGILVLITVLLWDLL